MDVNWKDRSYKSIEHCNLLFLIQIPNLYLLNSLFQCRNLSSIAMENVDHIYKYLEMCENKKEFDVSLNVYLTLMCSQPSKMQSRVVFV